MSYEQDSLCNPEPELLNAYDCHPHNAPVSCVPCAPIDPCARLKARVQSLEIELDRKSRCLEEKHQENRRLLSIKRELEQENILTKEEFDKLRKKYNIVEEDRDFYKRKRIKLRDLLVKEKEQTERLNEKNKDLAAKMEAAKKVTITTTTSSETSSDSKSKDDSAKKTG